MIAVRVTSGQTGAVWQRQMLAALELRLGRERALAAMLQRYLQYAATDQPVHTRPTPLNRGRLADMKRLTGASAWRLAAPLLG